VGGRRSRGNDPPTSTGVEIILVLKKEENNVQSLLKKEGGVGVQEKNSRKWGGFDAKRGKGEC